MKRFEARIGPVPEPLDMGHWANEATADLAGAQPPPRPSTEYRDAAIAKRRAELESQQP